MVSYGFAEEFVDIDFHDKRLTNRVVRIAETLGRACHASIPAAADGRSEMEAIYRFVGNAKVTPQKLTSQRRRATIERIRQCKTVLLVQDTTELDVTRPAQQISGAGPLTHHSRRGSYYHPLLAFGVDGLSLGTVWNKHWARQSIETDRTASCSLRNHRHRKEKLPYSGS